MRFRRKSRKLNFEFLCVLQVGITEYADRKCGTYSGGNKRKLNVAQALVADPPIIFLERHSHRARRAVGAHDQIGPQDLLCRTSC